MRRNLCAACTKALVINLDDLAVYGESNTKALDISSLPENEWNWQTGSRHFYMYERRPDELSRPRRPRRYFFDTGDIRLLSPPDFPELSVVESCFFCQKLKQLLIERYDRPEEWNEPGSVVGIQSRYKWDYNYNPHKEGLELRGMSFVVLVQHPWHANAIRESIDALHFMVAAWPGRCKDWLGITRRPVEPDGALSRLNVDTIRRWLGDCDEGHSCRHRAEVLSCRRIPTRLLQIQPDAQGIVLLDDTQSQLPPTRGEDIRYATLSYCWGKLVPVKTTSATLPQHCRGVAVVDLPVVFQDAVAVASKLGLRYLWIDALCIIQDDKTDWERESALMADVYASSYVTIAAAASSHCEESFLPRLPMDTLTVPIGSTNLPDMRGEIELVMEPGSEDIPYGAVIYTAWDGRAWVWQEQKMSARVLIFGPHMIKFTCHEGYMLEDGAERAFGSPQGYKSNIGGWIVEIQDYACRHITHPSDRLVAMAGVARAVKKETENAGIAVEYLAGLWSNLEEEPDQLLWYIPEAQTSFEDVVARLTNEAAYIAPSWSWASREARSTEYRSSWQFPPNDPAMFRLVRHDVLAARGDAYIAVQPGSSITLSGKLVDGASMMLQCARVAAANSHGHDNDDVYSPNLGVLQWKLDWNSQEVDEGQAVLDRQCKMFIAMRFIWKEEYDDIRGLVLLPCGREDGEAQYRRVGCFDVNMDCRGSEWIDLLLEQEVVII